MGKGINKEENMIEKSLLAVLTNIGLSIIFSILPGHLVFIRPRLILSSLIFKSFEFIKNLIALKANIELFI